MKFPSRNYAVGVVCCALLQTGLLVAAPEARGQSGQPGSAEVVVMNGRPVIQIGGEAILPIFYALTDVPGGRWSWEEVPQHNIAQFCRQGVRLFQVDLFLQHVWMEDDSFDLTKARKQLQGVREVCPDAGVVFRFHVNAPPWWRDAHPEEWVRYADRPEGDGAYDPEQPFGFPRLIEDDLFAVPRVSLASRKWQDVATEKTTEFLRRLAETPEASALVGIQVANGMYGEWHDWGFFYNEPDVGQPMTEAFRAWLRSTYGTDEALRAAWNDPAATIASATLPGLEDRETTHGIFRDPAREQRTIDYFAAKHETVAESIIHFAQSVKDAWPRPLVVGTFYGYFFSTFGRQAVGGHVELQRILKSPHIDYLSGPQAYEPETFDPGDPYRSRALLESMRLNGKLWLDEVDYEVGIPRWRGPNYERILRRAVALVRRNTAFTLAKGHGLWFYDFGVAGVDLDGANDKHRGKHGYWDHDVVLEEVRAIRELFAGRMSQPYETGADVLLVYDTQSAYHAASLLGSDPVSNDLIDYVSLGAFRSGVAFDPVHLEDLPLVDLSQYAVVVFGNVHFLTAEQRAFIQEEVAADGRHLVWHYAPGYTDGVQLNAAFVSEVTGMDLRLVELESAPVVEAEQASGFPFSYRVGSGPIAPLFAVDDPAAEPLATFAATGEVAIASKAAEGHTAWFVSLPSRDPHVMRMILRRTPAHRYTRDYDDVIYAGGGVVVLHTAEGGERTVTLRNGRAVELTMPPGPATLLLDAETGALLLPTPEFTLPPPVPRR
jgi:hypothetical protein